MQVVGVKNYKILVVCGHVRKLEFGEAKDPIVMPSSPHHIHPSLQAPASPQDKPYMSFIPSYLFIYLFIIISKLYRIIRSIPTLMVSYLQTISLLYIFTIMPLDACNLLLSNIILFSTSQVIHNQSLSRFSSL
jgi:hypothetical protein